MEQATAAGHEGRRREKQKAGLQEPLDRPSEPRPASPHPAPRPHRSPKGPLAVLHLGHVARRALPKPLPLPHTQTPGKDGEVVPLGH